MDDESYLTYDNDDIYERLRKEMGSPEDVLKRINDAESRGEYIIAYNTAYDATTYGVADFSDRLPTLKEKIMEMQRKLLESAPFDRVVIRTDGLFHSVCCPEMKEAVLEQKMGVSVDCMTNIPTICTDSPEIIKMILGEDVEDGEVCETSKCPFCGKEIYDYLCEFRKG